jgi:hypothetical protein
MKQLGKYEVVKGNMSCSFTPCDVENRFKGKWDCSQLYPRIHRLMRNLV